MRVALFNGIISGIHFGLIIGVWFSDFGLGIVVALVVVWVVLNSGLSVLQYLWL